MTAAAHVGRTWTEAVRGAATPRVQGLQVAGWPGPGRHLFTWPHAAPQPGSTTYPLSAQTRLSNLFSCG